MRPYLTLFLITILSTCVSAQSMESAGQQPLLGSWESTYTESDGRLAKLNMIIAADHMSMAAYYAEDGAFVATLGGKWKADSEAFTITYEFDSSAGAKVGSTAKMTYEINGNFLIFNGNKFWTRVDDGQSPLAGAWEITGRKVDGTMQDLSDRRTGPRKTMKILSGSRFQWIAFDTSTKEFKGSGGGTYTTNDEGTYVEKIEFFSRDATRVGQGLSFGFEVKNGDWHHSGKSSKGKPIYEVWSLRQ